MENVVVHIISQSLGSWVVFTVWKPPDAVVEFVWQSVWSLNDPEFKVSTWANHCSRRLFEIRPENRQGATLHIDEGKLKIGPFYICRMILDLQWSNVRNMIGQTECAKWANQLKWLLPWYLWKYGTSSSVLQKSGIHVAAFGRGVKPIGFDNQVLEWAVYLSIFWNVLARRADGSRVLGILLLALIYSNGNEIQWMQDEALAFWKQKLASWLCLNQPMVDDERLRPPTGSTKLGEAIRVANSYSLTTLLKLFWWDMCKQWKCASWTIISYGRIDDQEMMVEVHTDKYVFLPVYLKQAFKKTAICWSKWWNLWPSYRWSQSEINWPTPGRRSYKMHLMIVSVVVVLTKFCKNGSSFSRSVGSQGFVKTQPSERMEEG